MVKWNYKIKGDFMRINPLIIVVISILLFILTACSETSNLHNETEIKDVTPITDLEHTDNFQEGALEHILEGELNRKGKAVGFHYDRLPTKKGEIIDGTKTSANEHGVYEAKVIIEGVKKTSNQGYSTFFPDDWDTQEVIDAINEAYENRVRMTGNTYEGLTREGIIIRMYLNEEEKIISAFPIYE